MAEPKNILKTKTFWTGIAGLLAAASGYFTGDMSTGDAVQVALTSLIGIFLRSGISAGVSGTFK